MQKRLIVAVIAAIIAVPAFSRLTIYGTADVGFEYIDLGPDKDGAKVSSARLNSGIMNPSAFGVKGEQKLDDSLKAGFQFEAGFFFQRGLIASSGSNINQDIPIKGAYSVPLWGRIARVYLANKYGELSIGRQSSPIGTVKCNLDPTCGGFGFSPDVYWLVSDRIDNSIKYTTSSINSITAQFSYSTGDQNMTKDDVTNPNMPKNGGISYGVGVQYENGPVYAGFAARQAVDHDTFAGFIKPLKLKSYIFGAAYSVGKVKAFASFARQSTVVFPLSGASVNGVKDTIIMVGASMPLSRGTIVGEMTFLSDKSDYAAIGSTYKQADSRLFGVAYIHKLSKDVLLYLSATKMLNNINGKASWYSIGTASTVGPDLPKLGNNPMQFTLGVDYKF